MDHDDRQPEPTATATASRRRGRELAALIGTAVVAAAVTFGLTALLLNIYGHKQEAGNPFFRVVELTDETDDPAIWGKNFPQQYDAYLRTVDMERTKYGGSEAEPRSATQDDPRTVVSQSRIEEDPRLKRMWNGYAFAIDFREERGHAYMLEDQTFTKRQSVGQPGACLHCHASVYNYYKREGNGDIMAGFAKVNPLPYEEVRKHVEHPVACIDCHNPETMELRVTRPGFIEGIKVLKATEGIPNYDPNTMASRQEMRSFVCGQCHVEYYFKGDEKRLTYPWFKGLAPDKELEYYDEVGFKDWVHKETGAPMLKAQHPEFEIYNQGTHARAGVACADCHMPYQRVGAQKISDHQVRSPLLNISASCQTCHRVPEEELLARAENIQDKTVEMRNLALNGLMDLIDDIVEAQRLGATDDQLEQARLAQRCGGFLIDIIESENSAGFHAPQEAARLLNQALDHIRKGQVSLRGVLNRPATTSAEPPMAQPAPANPAPPARAPSR